MKRYGYNIDNMCLVEKDNGSYVHYAEVEMLVGACTELVQYWRNSDGSNIALTSLFIGSIVAALEDIKS